MENTCKQNDCKLWKKFKGSCPNYYINSFRNEETGKHSAIKDCAPIRTMLMIQELYNRFIGVQKSNEQQRNSTMKLFSTISDTIQIMADEKNIVIERPKRKFMAEIK